MKLVQILSPIADSKGPDESDFSSRILFIYRVKNVLLFMKRMGYRDCPSVRLKSQAKEEKRYLPVRLYIYTLQFCKYTPMKKKLPPTM